MKTVAQTVQHIISRSPFLRDTLEENVANTSKIARKIKKEIEDILLIKVSEASIIAALRRLTPRYPKKTKENIFNLSDIIVRTDLVEYIFPNPPNLFSIHEKILKKSQNSSDEIFLNIVRGSRETLVIVNKKLEKKIDEILTSNQIIRKVNNLSSISIRIQQGHKSTPGVYYPFLKILALQGISIVEIISIGFELSFIFEDKHIDRAFSVLKSLTV